MSRQDNKSCPFCGSNDLNEFTHNEVYQFGTRSNQMVQCKECKAENQKKMWNVRPITPLVFDREWLAKCIQEFIVNNNGWLNGNNIADAIIAYQSTILKQPEGISAEEIKVWLQKAHWADLNIDQLAQAIKTRLDKGK